MTAGTLERASPSFGVTSMSVRRFTVGEYERLIETGIIGENEEVELIHGWLVEKMGKNPPHSASTRRTRIALSALGLANVFVDVQEPAKLSDSVPEPDIALLRGSASDFDHRHVVPSDILIAIEVADTSLTIDRKVKLPLYAAAGIPVYWIINLIDYQLETFQSPTPQGTYAISNTWASGMEVPVMIDGKEAARIAVRDLFPAPEGAP